MEYQWIAMYDDGTELRQLKDDGTENRYADIVRNKLRGFVLLTRGQEPDYPILCLHVEEGCRLIYRRRTERWGNGGEHARSVWVLGMQRRTERGVVSECISAVFEDGHIEQKATWDDKTGWFYPPTVHPHEGEMWEGVPG